MPRSSRTAERTSSGRGARGRGEAGSGTSLKSGMEKPNHQSPTLANESRVAVSSPAMPKRRGGTGEHTSGIQAQTKLLFRLFLLKKKKRVKRQLNFAYV